MFRSRLSGYAWEQGVLPRIAPDHVLLSLCNIGPVARRRQLVMIHDAQVFDVPKSYSRAFRLGYQAILPLLARRVRWLATVSSYSRERLAANGIGAGRSIAVVPNGVDHLDAVCATPDAVRQHGLHPGGYFLVVGSAAPHKNLAMLSRANAMRSNPGMPIAVVGEENPAIFGHSDGRARNDFVSLGRISDAELKGLYRQARALLFPSVTEGFGLPALEAMRCGVAVIASDGGAIPEACGDAALYCRPSDHVAWAAAMDRLATDTTLAAELVDKGQAQAAHFTWDSSARRLLDILSAN